MGAHLVTEQEIISEFNKALSCISKCGFVKHDKGYIPIPIPGDIPVVTNLKRAISKLNGHTNMQILTDIQSKYIPTISSQIALLRRRNRYSRDVAKYISEASKYIDVASKLISKRLIHLESKSQAPVLGNHVYPETNPEYIITPTAPPLK